jgi:hypothetical protein
VTFDDDYRDNYLYAHPILQKYNLPATLCSHELYRHGPSHVERQDCARNEAHEPTKDRNSGAEPVDFARNNGGKTRVRWSRLPKKSKTLPETAQRSLADEVCRRLHNRELQGELVMLSWAELRKLAYEGWEVGSHTAIA